jgi:polysaccharide pyruvyl transferase WcaK-like protein
VKALLIGDVGGVDGYHAGDEAMLDVAISQLRARGAAGITVVSGDPHDTCSRYGVDAVARVGFAGREVFADDERDDRLAALLAVADGADDGALVTTGGAANARRLVDAVAASDAVLVTGGGNLSSSWPDQLYERAAILLLARRFGVPAVVSGQTIGPDLSDRHTAVLAQALAGASLVGLREASSYQLAADILPDLSRRSLQLDDAMFLPEEPTEPLAAHAALSDGFVALTVSELGAGPEAELRLDALSELVRAIYKLTRLTVLFLPHVGTPDGTSPSGDAAVAAALRQRLGDGPELAIAPVLPARQLAWTTRRSSAIITTRYHAAVFGMTAAVPCLSLYQDQYTGVKLRGALDHAGLGSWCLPVDALRTKLAGEAFAELWSRRGEIASHLRSVTAPWPAWDRAHWDEVWEALRGTTDAADAAGATATRVAPPAMTTRALEPKLASWTSATLLADVSMTRVADLELQLTAALLDAERVRRLLEAADAIQRADHDEINRLHAAVRAIDERRAEIEAEKIQLRDEMTLAEVSAEAARSLAAELLRRMEGERAAHAAQLDAISATKTMRWTAAARHSYGRLRRLLRIR